MVQLFRQAHGPEVFQRQLHSDEPALHQPLRLHLRLGFLRFLFHHRHRGMWTLTRSVLIRLNTTLDGSTCPKWKFGCLSQLRFFFHNVASDNIRNQALPPPSWWSIIVRFKGSTRQNKDSIDSIRVFFPKGDWIRFRIFSIFSYFRNALKFRDPLVFILYQ